MTEAPKREGQHGKREEGKREGGRASRRARSGGSKGIGTGWKCWFEKKEHLKIRTVILSGGTIRCMTVGVPFDFHLDRSDLLQLVLTGSIFIIADTSWFLHN